MMTEVASAETVASAGEMSNEFFSWIMLAQVTLPFALLCLVFGWVMWQNRKKSRQSARLLIQRIKENEDKEKDAIRLFLQHKIGLDHENSNKLSRKINNERKFLFSNLISGVLDKNAGAIISLESDLSRVLDYYHQLDVNPSAGEEQTDQQTDELDGPSAEEVAEMQQEIKNLKHEVHITLTTLNNIFGEFSSMFGEEVPQGDLSVEQIITAMESFAGKSPSEEAESESEPESESESEADIDADAFTDEDEAWKQAEQEALGANPGAFEFDQEESETPTPPSETDAAEVVEDSSVIDEAVEEDADEASDDNDNQLAMEEETLDFSLDKELDEIDSALDELELGKSGTAEPSWEDAFEETGQSDESDESPKD